MSFKDSLKQKIEREKYVSYGDLVNFALEEGYKADTMTRRMRELCEGYNPAIEGLEKTGKRNQKYIYGYKWVEYYPLPKDFAVITKISMLEKDPELVARQAKEINKILMNFPAPFPVKKEQDRLI